MEGSTRDPLASGMTNQASSASSALVACSGTVARLDIAEVTDVSRGVAGVSEISTNTGVEC